MTTAAAYSSARAGTAAVGRATGRERLVAAAAVLGGLLLLGGAFLPWLSLYAGLYPMRGVMGLWGRVLAAGGAACAVSGLAEWLRPRRRLAIATGVLAAALAAFGVWLVVQLLLTIRGLRADPMLVPQIGPGLFVAVAGALIVAAPAMPRVRRRRATITSSASPHRS